MPDLGWCDGDGLLSIATKSRREPGRGVLCIDSPGTGSSTIIGPLISGSGLRVSRPTVLVRICPLCLPRRVLSGSPLEFLDRLADLEPPPGSPALGSPTDWGELVQADRLLSRRFPIGCRGCAVVGRDAREQPPDGAVERPGDRLVAGPIEHSCTA